MADVTVAMKKLAKLTEVHGAAAELARGLGLHRAMITQWAAGRKPRSMKVRRFFARRGIKLDDWETIA
jgi:hypothetical protein